MKFAKEILFEDALVELLRDVYVGWGDYDVLMHPTEEDLIANWAKILYENNRDIDRLNDYPLTPTEMKQILDKVAELKTPLKINQFVNGKTVSIKRDNPDDKAHLGKDVALRIYDRNEIANGKSRYQIARQPEFKTTSMLHDRRGDIMLLINGMPLIHVELKRTGVPVSQAEYQIQNYAHEGVFTGIFSMIQVFVAMNPEDAVYFANPGPDGKFNPDFFFRWCDYENAPVKDWKMVVKLLLSIPMAHQLVGFYTVADETDGVLKVMRSYQYWAARDVTNRVSQIKWADKELYGGYVWHTTGSGKTLTSFKCAQLISESGHADKVVFLLNRIELGTQTYEAFQNFADDATDVQKTENTSALINKLKSKAGADALIVTSIQKMSRIKEDPAIAHDLALIRNHRLVFIVDECHTDTFGEMLATIKATFPAAIFFGFTGTPIMGVNSKDGLKQSDIFGNPLHKYTIAHGIRDKNVLGFDPILTYIFKDDDIRREVALVKANAKTVEEAMSDPHKMEIFQKWMYDVPMAGFTKPDGTYSSGVEDEIPESQYGENPKYWEKVVEDIAANWKVKSWNDKFHAILATSSIPEAFEYYKLLKAKMPDLKTAVVVDDSIDNVAGAAAKEDELVAMLKDYNASYGLQFSLPTFADFKKDVAARLAHKKPYKGIENDKTKILNLVIVVNQMLTGYDSKWINTLYLDKKLEYARLIQAFSRTNRLFGKEKKFGTIIYYRRPNTMKRNIEAAIKLYAGENFNDVFVWKLKGNLMQMNALFNQMRGIFAVAGIPDMSSLPKISADKAMFAKLFNDFNDVLSAAKVQGFRWDVPEFQFDEGKTTVKVEFSESEYLTLLQRYKELVEESGSGCGGSGSGGEGGEGGSGGGESTPPFDIDPTIIHAETGLIDINYINAKFKKLMQAMTSGEDTSIAMEELHKSFAMLSQEEQKFAQQFLDDVLKGMVKPDPNKSLHDYIVEYQTKAKDDQIHRFAMAFGADEVKLRELMSAHITTDAELNAFGRLDALLDTVDKNKAAEYFTWVDKKPVSIFEVNMRIHEYFCKFIKSGGFAVSCPMKDMSYDDVSVASEYLDAAFEEHDDKA